MKHSHQPPSATSLPRAPRDDASSRTRKYVIMMAIRVVCFLLMVLITPYGWYTWVLAAGAVFLPYLAVVIANVARNEPAGPVENPERALPATPAAPTEEPQAKVIRIDEARPLNAGPSTDAAPGARESAGPRPAPGSAWPMPGPKAPEPASGDPHEHGDPHEQDGAA